MSEEKKEGTTVNEIKELSIEEIDNIEFFGFKCRDVYDYDTLKDENGNPLWDINNMVLVGTYSDITFDETGHVTKFTLYGEDIFEINFYIKENDIYLEKDDILLLEENHELFKTVMDQFIGEDITHTIDFRGLMKD